jgi:hypothetical protein
MGLVITGVIIVGGVAPASVYGYIARRRGRNTSVSLTGPINGAGVRPDGPADIDLP